MNEHPNDPLFGKTLKDIVEYLINFYGFEELSRRIEINCFYSNPSLQSSLKFLRKAKWARDQVEDLYITTINQNK